MTTSPPDCPGSKKRPAAHLVQHDIRTARVESNEGGSTVVATVRCVRRDCELSVNVCARCERFARIEPHEAGYVLLCRALDELDPGDREGADKTFTG